MNIVCGKRGTVALFVLVCAIFLSAGCGNMQSLMGGAPKPSASLKDISFKSVSLTHLTLQFDVEISNPYDAPLPLTNIDYNLSSGDSRLLKGVADIQGIIPAKESKVVSLPVEVSYTDVISFARGLHGGPVPYDAVVNLSVDAPGLGRIPVPMERKGELKVPAIPGL